MITCQFAGGLGNNLFQFANIYNLHKKHNVPYFIDNNFQRLTFDGKPLKEDKRFEQSDTLEIEELFENKFVYLQDLDIDLKKMKNYYHHDLSHNNNFLYQQVPMQDNTIYHGYYQSEKYFLESNIKEDFVLNNNVVLKIKDTYCDLFKKPTISLQYRLGGDRKLKTIQKFHRNLKPDYYKKALKKICELNNLQIDDCNLLVFSDDISLARRVLSLLNLNFVFIENKNNIEDFIHMSLCDHNIIGNSTFAWWSSYFNSKSGTIVAPKDFFGANYNNFLLDDFYPKEWIIL